MVSTANLHLYTMGDSAARALGASMEQNSKLTHIDISCNNIRVAGAKVWRCELHPGLKAAPGFKL